MSRSIDFFINRILVGRFVFVRDFGMRVGWEMDGSERWWVV